MNNSGKTLKVLIAVDIQNCFIHGGSLAAFSTAEGSQNVYTKEKYINEKKGGRAIEQAQEVLEMMKGKDVVVITRDSHPDNHKSFISEGFIFEPHCRKSKKGLKKQYTEIQSCKTPNNKPPVAVENMPQMPMSANNKQPNKQPNAPNNSNPYANSPNSSINSNKNLTMNGGASYTNVNGKSQEIVGTDPALAYDFAAEGNDEMKNLVRKIKNCDLNVGFANEAGNQKRAIEDVTFVCEGTPAKQNGMPIFIDLRKGEKCDMDAYSAFNYHVTYSPASSDVPCAFGTSTMLLETLLSQQMKEAVGGFSKVEVDVCGLVGNICVMYTTTYGAEYAKMAAADPAKFQENYARLPELTYGGSVPPFHFNFHGRKGTQWLRTTDGKTPFPANPNGPYPRIGEDRDKDMVEFERKMIETQAKKQGVLDTITILELDPLSKNLSNAGLTGIGNVFGTENMAGGGRRKMKTRKNCWPKRSGGARKGTRKPKGHKPGCKCPICKRR